MTTIDVIAAFGYVAGALTAVKLARQAWRLWGPSTIKEAFSPELRAQGERNNQTFDALKASKEALIRQEFAPD